MECVTVSDIAAEAFVLLPDNCGLTRTTRHLFRSQGHAINAYEHRATGYQSMLDFVDASLCSVTLPESKIRDYPGTVIPIVDNGRPVAIEYIVFGQASNLPRKKFTELWDCLLESKLTVTRPSPCSTTRAFSGRTRRSRLHFISKILKRAPLGRRTSRFPRTVFIRCIPRVLHV
jgi:hypothetical protein